MNLLLSMDEDLSECMDMVVASEDGCPAGDGSEDNSSVLPTDTDCVCRVCGDSATGMYFGALVCVPCKVSPSFALSLSVSLSLSLPLCVPCKVSPSFTLSVSVCLCGSELLF